MIPTIRLRFSPTTPKLRARVYPGIPPLQAEFRNNGTAIQWRVGASGAWTDIATLTSITGPVAAIVAGTGIAVDSTDITHPIVSLGSKPDARDYLGVASYVATRAALKALDTSKETVAYLKEAGREGTFVFMAGNYAAQVTADTAEGIYLKADDTASSAGAWVRKGLGGVAGPTDNALLRADGAGGYLSQGSPTILLDDGSLVIDGLSGASGHSLPTINLRNNDTVNRSGAGGFIRFEGYSSANNVRDGVYLNGGMIDATDGAEQGDLDIGIIRNGAQEVAFAIRADWLAWLPGVDNIYDLGRSTFRLKNAFFTGTISAGQFSPTGGGVPSNGLYLPAANTLGWAVNSTAKMQLASAALSPAVDDGTALGTTSLKWSDLFLASGAVLNFNSGDVTVTHSADLLAFAGAASGYTFDAKAVVGHTANLSINGAADNLEVIGTTTATAALALAMFNATAATSAHLDFYRSKNAAIGSATVVASGDGLGDINWYGAQQTGTFATQSPAARIRAEVDGTVTSGASGDMPGRLVFGTTADGAGTVTDRLILDSAGILKPNANDGVALGTAALSFSDLFLASGAVVNFANSDVTLTHSTGLLTLSGTMVAASVAVSGSGVPSNGLYLPAANTIGFATNSTSRGFIDSTGKWTIGAAAATPLPVFLEVVANGNSSHGFSVTNASSSGAALAQFVVATGLANTSLNFNVGNNSGTPLAQLKLGSAVANFYFDTEVFNFRNAAGGTNYARMNSSGFDIKTGSLFMNGTKVVGTRVTGYTAMTGTPDKATAYATSSVTLAQLAGRVAQLQADLTTHGLIGA